MTTTQPENLPTRLTDHNPISTGTDVSNLGDYSSMTIKTTDGQELNIQLYGR